MDRFSAGYELCGSLIIPTQVPVIQAHASSAKIEELSYLSSGSLWPAMSGNLFIGGADSEWILR